MVESPLTGVVDEVVAPEGARVAAGATVLVVESMKMHHEVVAPSAGVVGALAVAPGDQVREGQPLFAVTPAPEGAVPPSPGAGDGSEVGRRTTAGATRADLGAVLARRQAILDDGRPDA